MKKLLVVLLSLGLLVAFGATASAADVKFGGSYYVMGAYENNPTLDNDKYSQHFFYQRIRLQPVFAIAEGLTFTARMDAMEKQWGQTNWKGGQDDQTATRGNSTNVAKRGAQESMEWERGYVTFMTKIGVFQIGYQNVDDWGTDFGDYSNSRPRVAYAAKVGPVTLNLTYEKVFSSNSANPTIVAAASGINTYLADGTKVYATAPVTQSLKGLTDGDNDTYALSAIYNAKGIEAGLLYKLYVYDANRVIGIKTQFSQLSPYLKATFGPVYVEGEATYWFGKTAQYEWSALNGAATAQDVDLKAWSLYLKGRMNVGPAYFGALFSYVPGNDLSDDTKNPIPPSGGGTNYSPALLLLNDGYNTQNAGNSAVNPALVTTNKYNSIIYSVFGGFNPTPTLNVEANLIYATVDKKALSKTAGVVTEAVSNKLGTEFDLKATYKIYDNLSYMVGAAYLWTGDYFKGANPNAKSDNDYLLLNQLTLSF